MKNYRILLITLITLFLPNLLFSQTTTINFKQVPFNTNDPHYWDNSGCKLYHSFGPNPIPLNGHNIRTVGNSDVWTPTYGLPGLQMRAFGNRHLGEPYENGVLSIEYFFEANNNYEVEIVCYVEPGYDAQGWNGVLWTQLHDDPTILSNVSNKCESSDSPVERKVDRYSKIFAEQFETADGGFKTCTKTFAVTQNKNALKLIFDSSPRDGVTKFNGKILYQTVKITKMPFQEIYGERTPYYNNISREYYGARKDNPVFDIPFTPPPPAPIPPKPPRGERKSFVIKPTDWKANEATGYVIDLNVFLEPETYISLVNDVFMKGDTIIRRGVSTRENILLPGAYQGNNYTYVHVDGHILVFLTNATNSLPINDIEFNGLYYISEN